MSEAFILNAGVIQVSSDYLLEHATDIYQLTTSNKTFVNSYRLLIAICGLSFGSNVTSISLNVGFSHTTILTPGQSLNITVSNQPLTVTTTATTAKINNANIAAVTLIGII